MDIADQAQEREQFFRDIALTCRPRPGTRPDTNTGGLCIDCHKPIPAARIRACPDAVRCVTCQAKVESME